MNRHPLRTTLAILPLSALLLAGCSTGSDSAAAGIDELKLVATTNVYGQIARAIGGEHVQVSEVITSTAQDPHSYEPTARDKLTISEATIVLANGGGYDSFMDTLVDSLPGGQAETVSLIHAVDTSPIALAHAEDEDEDHDHDHDHAEEGHDHAEDEEHEHAEYNEHIWYDLDSMQELAEALSTQLGEKDPQHAADYTANAADFTAGLDRLRTQLSEAGLEGESYLMTEPVPQALLDDAGMVNETPDGLSEAIEEGQGVAVLTMKEAQDMLAAGEVSMLAYNTQTEGAETKQLRESAESSSTPIVDFAETITDDSTYLEWMESNIANLASALKG